MSGRWYRPPMDAACVAWLAATNADGYRWNRNGEVIGWPRPDHSATADRLRHERAARAYASSGGALRVPT